MRTIGYVWEQMAVDRPESVIRTYRHVDQRIFVRSRRLVTLTRLWAWNGGSLSGTAADWNVADLRLETIEIRKLQDRSVRSCKHRNINRCNPRYYDGDSENWHYRESEI